MSRCSRILPACIALLFSLGGAPSAFAQTAPKNATAPPHGFFSNLLRVFGRVERFDPAARTLTFAEERTGETWTQPLKADTDVFMNELPVEASELKPGVRVWIAMEGKAAAGQRGPIRFIADEPTYQALHGTWYTVREVRPTEKKLVLETGQGSTLQRTELPTAADFRYTAGSRRQGLADLKPGALVRFQRVYANGAYEVTHAVSQLGWALNKARQAAAQDVSLAAAGLPGELFARDGAASTLLIYRAGSGWARRLKAGDRVTIQTAGAPAPQEAEVRGIHPWGEKTRVAVHMSGAAASELGTPIRLNMPRPARATLPPGLGISQDPEERVEWFLSTIFCTCAIMGDRCTGHLYTLSMCDHKGCGKPNAMKTVLRGYISQGLSDADILKRLEADEGPFLLTPHLLQ